MLQVIGHEGLNEIVTVVVTCVDMNGRRRVKGEFASYRAHAGAKLLDHTFVTQRVELTGTHATKSSQHRLSVLAHFNA